GGRRVSWHFDLGQLAQRAARARGGAGARPRDAGLQRCRRRKDAREHRPSARRAIRPDADYPADPHHRRPRDLRPGGAHPLPATQRELSRVRLATVRQCAMLVGGLGTRLGAVTADTPKPMLPCGDRPFVAWLLREFVRFGVSDFVLLTGHLSARIEQNLHAIAERLPVDARVTLSEEPLRAGIGGAVFHARDRLDERFLLCNGDSLFDCNLARLLAASAGDGSNVLGRVVLRRMQDASRYGVVELAGDRITAF